MMSVFTALQLFILQPTKVEPEVSLFVLTVAGSIYPDITLNIILHLALMEHLDQSHLVWLCCPKLC